MRKRKQGASAPSSPALLDSLIAERNGIAKQLEQARAQVYALNGALSFCNHAIDLASGKVAADVKPQPGIGAARAAAEAQPGADTGPAALNGSGAPVGTD